MSTPDDTAQRGATAPAMPDSFPTSGFVRLKDILAPRGPIPVARSTWWKFVAAGRFPAPMRLSPRIAVWRAEDIRALIEKGAV